jgi:hypothetical protein
LPLALATFGALQWGDRRGRQSSALLAFTTLKPTFGGPLGILLFGRRDWRSALGGLALGGLLCLAGFTFIFLRSGTDSLGEAIQILARNHSDFYADPTVIPKNNKGRIDLVTAVEYMADRSLPAGVAPLVALSVLGLTGFTLWRATLAAEDRTAVSTGSAVAILAMYICIYHNVYDLPLLIVPIAACATAAHASWRRMSPAARRTVLCLMLLPFINFFWTDGFRHVFRESGFAVGWADSELIAGLFRFTHAANGFALAAAWGILIVSLLSFGKTATASHRFAEEHEEHAVQSKA